MKNKENKKINNQNKLMITIFYTCQAENLENKRETAFVNPFRLIKRIHIINIAMVIMILSDAKYESKVKF